MPPKTNQQRIKDIEEAIKELEDKLASIVSYEELEKPTESSQEELDKRFENQADAINELKQQFATHVWEPGAHDGPHLAMKRKQALKKRRESEKQSQ